MNALAIQVIAYVTEQTKLRGRGPMHTLSLTVGEIAEALDCEAGALQTAIRKAWAADWLRIDQIRGDDEAHAVTLGERR